MTVTGTQCSRGSVDIHWWTMPTYFGFPYIQPFIVGSQTLNVKVIIIDVLFISLYLGDAVPCAKVISIY